MKKLSLILAAVTLALFVTGCAGENQQSSTNTEQATPAPSTKDSTADLQTYENGELRNDDKNKSIDKWYFIKSGKKTESGEKDTAVEEKYLLIIDDKCLVHFINLTNETCLKYLTTDEERNVLPVSMSGEILSDKSIQASDIVLQQ